MYEVSLDFANVTLLSVVNIIFCFSPELQIVSKETWFKALEYSWTVAMLLSESDAVRSKRVLNISVALLQSVGISTARFCFLVSFSFVMIVSIRFDVVSAVLMLFCAASFSWVFLEIVSFNESAALQLSVGPSVMTISFKVSSLPTKVAHSAELVAHFLNVRPLVK